MVPVFGAALRKGLGVDAGARGIERARRPRHVAHGCGAEPKTFVADDPCLDDDPPRMGVRAGGETGAGAPPSPAGAAARTSLGQKACLCRRTADLAHEGEGPGSAVAWSRKAGTKAVVVPGHRRQFLGWAAGDVAFIIENAGKTDPPDAAGREGASRKIPV